MSVKSPISRPEPAKLSPTDGQRSVKKNGELLEDRVHLPQRVLPSPTHQPLRSLAPRNLHQGSPMLLPEAGQLSKPVTQHPRYLIPRTPLTIGTHYPNENPPLSTHSQSSGDGSDTVLSLPEPPAGLFALNQVPPRQPSTDYGSCASPTTTFDLTSRTSIATEYLFRQSTASSSVIRLSNIPPFPPPWYPPPTQDPPRPQDDPRLRAAGLIPPLKAFFDPEVDEKTDSIPPPNIPNPRWTRVSLASSQAIPTSWGYDFQRHSVLSNDANVQRGYMPTIYTPSMPNTASTNSSLHIPALPLENSTIKRHPTAPSATIFPEDAPRTDFISPTLSEAAQRENTKNSPILEEHTGEQHNEKIFSKPLTNEVDGLSKPALAINEKSSGALKHPQSDTGVLRDIEARSTTPLSLIDLIRSATELTSNSDHRNAANECRRNSGSFSDLLAEFPPPGSPTPKGRALLPISLWRSSRRNNRYIESDKDPGSSAPPFKRRCHGLSKRQLILICILVLGTVLLAILLPVLLVHRSKTTSTTSCEKTTPCQNGGVSVSSTTGCSCVCVNGYTGTQCTAIGDSSCVTSDSTSSKNATMGSSLPSIFDRSQTTFGIPLDEDAIMAFFSMNNISCKTENNVVSFDGIYMSSDTENARRSIRPPINEDESEVATISIPATKSTMAAPRSLATKSGILYDESDTNTTTLQASTESDSMNVTIVPTKVVEFSQVALLYILGKTGTLDSAVNTKKDIQLYLVDYYNSAVHPSLQVLDSYDLDFENTTITLPNGTMIGG